MIFISHRGNLAGPNAKLENAPVQIEKVLKQGHNCEIDVWFIDNNYLHLFFFTVVYYLFLLQFHPNPPHPLSLLFLAR